MRLVMNLLVSILIVSCSNEVNSGELLEFSSTDFPQKWKLSHINAGLSGKILDADESSVREIYVLQADGTFSKEFQDEFNQGTVDGVFELASTENRRLITLTYNFEIDSLSYCSKNNEEIMVISEDSKTLSNGSCLAFDGPGLYYQRIE